MNASEGCRAYFLSELFGGVSEGVHAEPFFFRDGPPWLSKRRGEWVCG
jgi:hypothetical protein